MNLESDNNGVNDITQSHFVARSSINTDSSWGENCLGMQNSLRLTAFNSVSLLISTVGSFFVTFGTSDRRLLSKSYQLFNLRIRRSINQSIINSKCGCQVGNY